MHSLETIKRLNDQAVAAAAKPTAQPAQKPIPKPIPKQ